jgi:hypothetical protein
MPAYDIEFNATWTANFYEAVFSANGGLFPDGDSIKKFSTEYITQITLPPTPVREGYEFVGWAFNGKNIGTNVGIMDSIEGKEFEAIWMSNETTKYRIETYTMNTVGEYERTAITLNGNLYDKISLAPEAEEGFVLNEEKSVLSGTLTANNTLVLKVYYDRCQYKFKVFASGTETITLYYYGAMIAEPAVPEKEGYVFDGWSSEIPATMPAENVSVSAKFRKAQNVDRTPSIVIVTPEDHTLNYGESITLQVRATYLPAGSSIKWSVEGDGVSIKPSTNGRNCKVTSTSNGNVVVKAYVVDSRGNSIAGSDGKPLADIEYIYSKVTFWQIVISYIRQIFGITNNMIF